MQRQLGVCQGKGWLHLGRVQALESLTQHFLVVELGLGKTIMYSLSKWRQVIPVPMSMLLQPDYEE